MRRSRGVSRPLCRARITRISRLMLRCCLSRRMVWRALIRPLRTPFLMRRCWLNWRWVMAPRCAACAGVCAIVMAGAAMSAATSANFANLMVFLLLWRRFSDHSHSGETQGSGIGFQSKGGGTGFRFLARFAGEPYLQTGARNARLAQRCRRGLRHLDAAIEEIFARCKQLQAPADVARGISIEAEVAVQ